MGGERKSPLRILSRFRTIRGAMIFSYMAITLVALLIFLLFSLNYTERTILENSESYTIQLVEQVNGDIDSYISYMENIMDIVTNNPELSDYLFDRMEHIMMRERIQEQFVTLMDARSDICNIAVFAKNGRTLINRGTDTRNPYVDLASMPWYQDTMEAEGKAVISASHVQNAIEGKYQWVITLSKGLLNPETHEVEGIFFVDMNYSSIQELCTNVNLGSKSYLFIVGKKGKIIYHPKQQLLYSGMKTELIDEVLENGTGNFLTSQNGRRQLYSVFKSDKTGWSVVGVSDVLEFMKNRSEIQFFYLLIALCLGILSLLLALWLSGEITKPVKELEQSMKNVQKGEFDKALISPEGCNEITSLTHSFNIMTEKIQNLMAENVREQKQKRKSELQALQAQINPHFLYNTLDSIIWMAESGKNEEVVQMTSALAKLLRQSISNEDEIVTVEREIEYTRNYLAIQKLRYRDQLEYIIDIDEEVLHRKIVKLVIQPLVENAIYHGIKYLDGKGMILILGEIRDGKVVITIRDNGVGMDEETLKHILEKKPEPKEKQRKKTSHVGVYNVQNRLQLYYGKEYGLVYESMPGMGTGVSVIIPAEEGEES